MELSASLDMSTKTKNTTDIVVDQNTCPRESEPTLTKKGTVCYIYNDDLIKLSNQVPKIQGRASIVHSLLQAYGLLDQMRLISARPAKEEELLLFHSQEYVDCVKRLSDREDEEKYDEDAEMFGLSYDCPAYPGVYEYANYVAGGSIKAAQCLMMGGHDVAIHWTGGWHHAKRDEASGFCYFNDIVLAILKLRQKFDRVLYIDVDLHHGDGVEDAFCATPKVMTVSFHKYSPGFFPGTGQLSNRGIGRGKNYSVNVPLKDGIQDKKYLHVFDSVVEMAREAFKPDAVVCQCGADSLVGDPMDSFNLSLQAYVECIKCIRSWKLPLLLLGGGGYSRANTARCWAAITAEVLGQTLPEDIPEHKYFPMYGPDYELNLTLGNRSDKNSAADIESILSQIQANLHNVVTS